MRRYLLLLILTTGLTVPALEVKWDASKLLTWKGAEQNSLRVVNGALIPRQPVLIETKIRFPAGSCPLLKVTLRLSEKMPTAPLTLIAVFQGGREAGNHFWNQLIRAGMDHGGPVYECFLTVPADANELDLKLRLGDNGATAGIREVTVSEAVPATLKDRLIRVKVDPGQEIARPDAFHFGANLVGDFPGVYYGTLPPDDPKSRRADYVAFLKESGLRSVRYPGGCEALYFLPESRRAALELFKLTMKRDTPYLVSWADYKATMKEAGLKIIYQLNSSFYLDDQGVIQAIDDTELARRSGLDRSRKRHAEAAAALERNFRNGVFTPADVDYWELGNEEFALMTTEQYADVCAALIPVIQRNDPGKPICVTGMQDLEEKLRERGVWDAVTGITVHYPYASWPRPNPAYLTADYRAFAHADVRFGGNLAQPAKRASGKKITVSETSVYNLFTYDFNRMQASYALGMAIARNWPVLLADPLVDMAVFHDFESNYFGLSRFDVSFSDIDRKFVSMKGAPAPPKTLDNQNWFVDPSRANSTRYFPGEYLHSAGTEVLAMLAAFENGCVYAVDIRAHFGAAGGYLAGRDAAGHPLLFISNPLETPVLLQLQFPGFPPKCTSRQINADNFGAALAHEYRKWQREVELANGNTLILPARSVTLLQGK